MLALPRGGTLRADYSLIAIYLSICAAESQYAGKIVALCKPKSRYGNGGTGCPVCPNRAGGSPCPGGELCREPQRGLPLRAAGAQEGRQPAVFHPLVNLPFSLRGHGGNGRRRPLRKKECGRGFFVPRCIRLFVVSDTVLLHPIWVYAGAAQQCRATRLRVHIAYIRRIWIICTSKKFARHGYAAPAWSKPPV